jgi:phosphate transport system substrate-binding protein
MKGPGVKVLASRSRVIFVATLCCLASFLMPSTAWAEDGDTSLVIRGSSTLQPLVEQWATTFGRQGPAPSFDIEATGTSEGINDLLEGRTDIAMASRPLDQDEIQKARKNGLVVRDTIVARMGIAVVVNRQNQVTTISVDKLAAIFSGDIRNWQGVGGPDESIVVIRKDSGWSPDFFRKRIMGDKAFIQDAVVADSKEDVVAEVSNRRWSIGVTGMPEAIPALDRVGLVRMVDGESQQDSTYALSRPLFFFSVEDSAPINEFLSYVTGKKAQEMIAETGFYPSRQADAMSDE